MVKSLQLPRTVTDDDEDDTSDDWFWVDLLLTG